MEVLFLYHRLYHIAGKQLEALKKLDLGTLEKLTKEREEITRSLCASFVRHFAEGEEALPESVGKKIHELTARTLDIDAQVKELLLEELRERTLELSAFDPNNSG